VNHFKKTKLLKEIALGFCLFCICSCGNDGRLVKKFVERMNDKEINAASKYVYPGDHANLYFFNEEVLSKTPNLLMKIVDKKDVTIDGQKGIVVKIECKNVSRFFVNYMQNLNMIDGNNCIADTIFIKETRDGNKITFDWAKIQGENLYLANIRENQEQLQHKISSLNIRAGESENSDIIGNLPMNKKIVIDEYSENPDWVQCFTIDHTCRIVQGHIKKSPALVKNSLFFNLGIFDGLSLLVAMIILVVIAFPVFYIGSIVRSLMGRGCIGVIVCVALIFGLIYVLYQLLENILFELFLINLPY
jgi:hypothetical protein